MKMDKKMIFILSIISITAGFLGSFLTIFILDNIVEKSPNPINLPIKAIPVEPVIPNNKDTAINSNTPLGGVIKTPQNIPIDIPSQPATPQTIPKHSPVKVVEKENKQLIGKIELLMTQMENLKSQTSTATDAKNYNARRIEELEREVLLLKSQPKSPPPSNPTPPVDDDSQKSKKKVSDTDTTTPHNENPIPKLNSSPEVKPDASDSTKLKNRDTAEDKKKDINSPEVNPDAGDLNKKENKGDGSSSEEDKKSSDSNDNKGNKKNPQ